MRMHPLFTSLLAAAMLGGMICGPICANAQRYSRRDHDWRTSRYTMSDVRRIIDRLEENSNQFREQYERSLRNGYLPGTNRSDNLKDRIQRLDESLERLRRDWDRHRDWRDNRDMIQDVLREARPVDRLLYRRSRIDSVVGDRWDRMRQEMNRLADIYGLDRLR